MSAGFVQGRYDVSDRVPHPGNVAVDPRQPPLPVALLKRGGFPQPSYTLPLCKDWRLETRCDVHTRQAALQPRQRQASAYVRVQLVDNLLHFAKPMRPAGRKLKCRVFIASPLRSAHLGTRHLSLRTNDSESNVTT